MVAVDEEELRRSTLRRQFPPVQGSGPDAVLRLLDQLGPLQSQVPRAPFVSLAARLPGTDYATVCGLFESHQLLKASNLRGTVHTGTRRGFGWLDAVATLSRAGDLRRALRLRTVTAAQVDLEVRRFCASGWRPRADLVRHLRGWLAEHESGDSAAALTGTFSESVVWGNSGLVRRPRGTAWETRTDAWHHTAATLVDGVERTSTAEALVALVRGHLTAHGPATRADLSFFLGVGLTPVDAAVTELGDALVRLQGPDRETYLDLAEPPPEGSGEPGLRLLAEFDALLLGFCGRHRTRFVDDVGLGQIWAKANGLFKPVVLDGGRLVATWRTRTERGRTVLEVTPLTGAPTPADDAVAGPAADLARALDLDLADVQVLSADPL
jgi:hypothetical protein